MGRGEGANGSECRGKNSSQRRDKTRFTSQGQHGKATGGNRVSRDLEPDLHQGDTWLYPSPSLTHPTHHIPKGWRLLQVPRPLMGRWRDPAPPRRHSPCTAAGSSAQSPRHPSIMLMEVAVGAGSMSQHSCPGQSFLQIILGTAGLLIPQSPTPPPSLFPVSVGETAAVGERMGMRESREKEEQRTNLISSSIQPPPLFPVKWEGGLRGRTENLVMPNFKPLPFTDPGKSAGPRQPFPGWKPK